MKAINMQMNCSIKSAGKNDSSALTSEATDMATEFFLQNPEALRMLSPSLEVDVLEHIFKTLNQQA